MCSLKISEREPLLERGSPLPLFYYFPQVQELKTNHPTWRLLSHLYQTLFIYWWFLCSRPPYLTKCKLSELPHTRLHPFTLQPTLLPVFSNWVNSNTAPTSHPTPSYTSQQWRSHLRFLLFFNLPHLLTHQFTQILLLSETQIGSSFLILTDSSLLTWIFTNNFLTSHQLLSCLPLIYFHTVPTVLFLKYKSYIAPLLQILQWLSPVWEPSPNQFLWNKKAHTFSSSLISYCLTQLYPRFRALEYKNRCFSNSMFCHTFMLLYSFFSLLNRLLFLLLSAWLIPTQSSKSYFQKPISAIFAAPPPLFNL